MFATLWGKMRATMIHAGFTNDMKQKLFAEVPNTLTHLHNLQCDKRTTESPYKRSYGYHPRWAQELKRIGELVFHLGCDFKRDKDGTFYYGPRRYIDKMVSSFKQMFNNEVTPSSSSLVERDHLELDTSEFLIPDDVTKYQSLIGSLQ